jgi:hypothetical protein
VDVTVVAECPEQMQNRPRARQLDGGPSPYALKTSSHEPVPTKQTETDVDAQVDICTSSPLPKFHLAGGPNGTTPFASGAKHSGDMGQCGCHSQCNERKLQVCITSPYSLLFIASSSCLLRNCVSRSEACSLVNVQPGAGKMLRATLLRGQSLLR